MLQLLAKHHSSFAVVLRWLTTWKAPITEAASHQKKEINRMWTHNYYSYDQRHHIPLLECQVDHTESIDLSRFRSWTVITHKTLRRHRRKTGACLSRLTTHDLSRPTRHRQIGMPNPRRAPAACSSQYASAFNAALRWLGLGLMCKMLGLPGPLAKGGRRMEIGGDWRLSTVPTSPSPLTLGSMPTAKCQLPAAAASAARHGHLGPGPWPPWPLESQVWTLDVWTSGRLDSGQCTLIK